MQHRTQYLETIPPKMQAQSIAARSAIKYTMGYDERWRSGLDFSQEPTSPTRETFICLREIFEGPFVSLRMNTQSCVRAAVGGHRAHPLPVASGERRTLAQPLWRGRQEREEFGLKVVTDSLERPVSPSSDTMEPKDQKKKSRTIITTNYKD